MAFKKTYEIIETIPSILKTKIPLVDIISYSAYFVSSPFYIIYKGIKDKNYFKAFFSNKKKLAFDGAENKTAIIVDLEGMKKEFKKIGILKTEIIYHENKDSVIMLKELLAKGYKINVKNLNPSFIIKEKTEYYNSEEEIDKKEEVLISTPFLAEKIANILHLSSIRF